MKRLATYIGFLILLAGCSFSLLASDEVFIGDGDIASLNLYDSQGNPLEATSEQAQNIAEGWIINNPDTPILLVTPRGTINVFEDSLLVTGNLVGKDADLYLVSGKATFNTFDMDGGSLTVTTPVSRFILHGDGEMLVITTAEEESVTTFTGEVESYNSLTGAKRSVKTFEKLFMQEKMARLKRIESGYYLTYATYPDMMLAKQIMQELSKPVTAPAPLAPTARVEEIPLKTPPLEGVTIQALAPRPSTIGVSEQDAFIPKPLQSIDVSVEKIKVPPTPRHISNIILTPPKDRITVTIRPMVSEKPTFSKVTQEVVVPEAPTNLPITAQSELAVVAEITEGEPVSVQVPLVAETKEIEVLQEFEQVINESIPIEETDEASLEETIDQAQETEQSALDLTYPVEETEEPALEVTPSPEETEEPALEVTPSPEETEEPALEVTPSPEETEEPALEVTPSPKETEETALEVTALEESRPTLAFSAEEAEITGSFGVDFGYRFIFDDSNDTTVTHQIYLKPYYSKGLFSIKLQGSMETRDFSSLSNSLSPIPTSRLEQASYIFSYIDQLRFGYNSSTFYGILDRTFPLTTELTSLYAPSLFTDQNLAMLGKISVGSFTWVTSFDDLYFTALKQNNRQFGSSLLQFTPKSGYRMSVALGSLGVVDRLPWKLDLYPFMGLSFPVINSRTTQMKLLLQASGFLPSYPTLTFDSFVDTSVETFFPNYLLGTGFSLKKQSLYAKVLLSLTEGENHNLVFHEFASSQDTSYQADFELLGDFRYEAASLTARLLFNLPFSSGLSISQLSNVTEHTADYEQLTVSYNHGNLTLGVGFASLGILRTIGDVAKGEEEALTLLRGPYNTSFLSVQYLFDPFTLGLKAQYPPKSTSYTIPILTVSASVNLEKQF